MRRLKSCSFFLNSAFFPRGSILQHNHLLCFCQNSFPVACWDFIQSWSAPSVNNPLQPPSARDILLWREWRLSWRIQSVALARDYMFSSNSDVILKGFSPVAAYLWLCIAGLQICTQSPTILPLQLFLFSWWGSPLFWSCSWTADPPAKVPPLIGLDVLFMAPVKHNKLLDHDQNKMAQFPQENHFFPVLK